MSERPKCPECGAEVKAATPVVIEWECGSHSYMGQYFQKLECAQTQVAALRERLATVERQRDGLLAALRKYVHVAHCPECGCIGCHYVTCEIGRAIAACEESKS